MVSNLDEQVVSSLRIRYERSLEEEFCEVLKRTAELAPEQKLALVDRMRAMQARPLEIDSADLIREDRDSR